MRFKNFTTVLQNKTKQKKEFVGIIENILQANNVGQIITKDKS